MPYFSGPTHGLLSSKISPRQVPHSTWMSLHSNISPRNSHSYVPSYLVLPFWLLLPQKTCSALLHPFLSDVQKAGCWPAFPWTDKLKQILPLNSDIYFCFSPLLNCQFSSFWKLYKIVYPWSHCFLTKCGCLILCVPVILPVCGCEQSQNHRFLHYQLHITHSLGASSPHNSLEAVSQQTSGLQTPEGAHKGSVLLRWGIHLQVSRAPAEHEQARYYKTQDWVFLQKHLFF